MGKRQLAMWTMEFVCVTAIGVVLSTPIGDLWILPPALFLVATKVVEYRAGLVERYEIVKSQLDLLQALLPHVGRDLRCTYHVPVRYWGFGRVQLMQAFDYLPTGGGGKRRFPGNKGIIGKAYQEKIPKVVNFVDDGEYRLRMMTEFNFSQEELQHRTADRKSYLCIPVLDDSNHDVLGLVYFDSNQTGTFELANGNANAAMITAACDVIRAHLA